MSVSFTRAGRAKHAEQAVAQLLDRLFATTERLSFRGVNNWTTPYAVGFLWRHVWFGQEAVKRGFWCGMLGGLTPGYPNDDEQGRLFFRLVSPRLDIPEASLLSAYETAVGRGDQRTAFEHGVAEADRILNRLEFGHVTEDDHGRAITTLERRFRDLPGRHSVSRSIGLARPAKLYPYLVAHTLGPAAFQVVPDDAALARLLGFDGKA